MLTLGIVGEMEQGVPLPVKQITQRTGIASHYPPFPAAGIDPDPCGSIERMFQQVPEDDAPIPPHGR